MRKILARFGSVLVFLSCLYACNNRALIDETVSLPAKGWNYDSLLTFSFPITDTSGVYDVSLHVRNAKQYKYSNLWIFLETTAPNGARQKDTLELILADETGHWLGKGTRSINTMLIPYMRNIKFPYLGVYQMQVQHAMRDTTLNYIHDFGIRIVNVN